MEARNIAQRYAILFCVKLGDSATTTHEKLQQAFGDDATSKAQAFRWHKMFSSGRTIVEDEEHSGRPSATRTSDNTARARELVRSDRRLTVNMTADEVNVNREALRRILTKQLGMRKICAKMVPRNLTQQQWDARVSVSAELLKQVEADPDLMERVITGDESWFFQYDPETKHQSLEWCSKRSPRPKKARMSKTKLKCMLVCFFDSIGIFHKKCVPAGQTVNQYYYKDILERLRKRVMRVRPSIVTDWILHHDNAPAHAAFSVAQFLTSKGITVMPQPPYSPDLAPCDFFLFQKTKSAMKGRHFESTEDIQRSVTQALNDILQAAFQECYKQWQQRWKTCVQAQGMYFEGDHILVDG